MFMLCTFPSNVTAAEINQMHFKKFTFVNVLSAHFLKVLVKRMYSS